MSSEFPSQEECEAVLSAFEERFGVEVTALQYREGRFVVCLGPPNLIFCDDHHWADTGEPIPQWIEHDDPEQPVCCGCDGLRCAIDADREDPLGGLAEFL